MRARRPGVAADWARLGPRGLGRRPHGVAQGAGVLVPSWRSVRLTECHCASVSGTGWVAPGECPVRALGVLGAALGQGWGRGLRARVWSLRSRRAHPLAIVSACVVVCLRCVSQCRVVYLAAFLSMWGVPEVWRASGGGGAGVCVPCAAGVRLQVPQTEQLWWLCQRVAEAVLPWGCCPVCACWAVWGAGCSVYCNSVSQLGPRWVWGVLLLCVNG